MGQRHQIYVRLPKIYYNENNPNNRDEITIGVHHQWLYGKTALRQLMNFLTFIKNQNKYGPFLTGQIETAMDALSTIYSVDVSEGYFHQVFPLWEDNKDGTLGEECSDPTIGDNNNGITVIDLSDKIPKYCFMSVKHLECLDKSQKNNYTNFKPMSAEEYLLLHYPNYKTKLKCNCPDCLKDPKIKKTHDKEMSQHVKFCEKLVNFFKDFKIITRKDVRRIFPKLKLPTPQSIQFIEEED